MIIQVEERLVKCATNSATPRDVQWKQCISFNGIRPHQGQRKKKKKAGGELDGQIGT